MKRPQGPEHVGVTASVTTLLPFLRLVEEQEPTVMEAAFDLGERLLARWDITRAELEADPRRRLPFALIVELLTGFVEILGDPSAPLRAGMKLKEGDYDLIECLASTCNTLGEAIECVGRYYALLGPAELELAVLDDRAEARFRMSPGIDVPDAVNEFAMASNFAMSILHVQLQGVEMPIEVCFTHAEPAHADVFANIFFVPVRFGCPHNAIVFSKRMVSQPMKSPNAVMHTVLTRLADLELDALVDKSAFPAKVRQAIEQELASGAALELAAARLHMSPSALRSRLQKYGTSYSALLDGVRRDLAKRALRQAELSISEVAHSLGFAHPPAFHRAVRRWFGVTPNEYRDAPSDHPVARFWRRK